MNLGDRIRSAREAAGLSQGQLAEKVNVATRTIWNWERGGASPRSKLGALERALGVQLRGQLDDSRDAPRLPDATDAQLVVEFSGRLAGRDARIRALATQVDELRGLLNGTSGATLPERWAARRRENPDEEPKPDDEGRNEDREHDDGETP